MPRFISKVLHFGSAHGRPGQRLVAVGLVVVVMVAWSAGASATKQAIVPSLRARGTPLITPTPAQIRGVITPAVPGDPFSEVQAGLMSKYPNSFGGLYVNKLGQYVITTAGPPSAALRRSAKTGFASAARVFGAEDGPILPIQLTYVNTGVTLHHLYDLKAAILDNPALRSAGVDGAGLDIEHGRLVVMSRTQRGEAAVTADYGSAVRVLVDSGSGLYASRYGDTPPFNGGDQIITPSGGETTCTSGFGMQDATTGREYLLTAGHCGSATWYNTRTDDPVYNSSTLVGTTVRGSVVTAVIDAQLISTSASCISWGGKSTKAANDDRLYVTGYFDPPQGAAIQTEGSVSTQQSGTVAYYDTSVSTGGESLQDLDLITPMGTFGDSGGPMIYPTEYGPLAGGTIVGWYESGDEGWGVIQLIDAEVFTYSVFLGDQVVPITSTTGDSC
jgi:hypothetical protein